MKYINLINEIIAFTCWFGLIISSILLAIFGNLKILNNRAYLKNEKFKDDSNIGITIIISRIRVPPLR